MTANRRTFNLILLGYRAADTLAAIDLCERLFRREQIHRRLLVLNRADLVELVSFDRRRWEVVVGTNTLGEFSGWMEGLAHLKDLDSGVIFVNDTVATHRHFTGARGIALLKALRSASPSSMVGFTDRGERTFFIAGLELNAWVSTFCFLLTAEALSRLDRRLYEPAMLDRLVPGGLDEAKFFAELSEHLEKRLTNELFGGAWYGGERLSPGNVGRLSLKARCIVAEMLLSARCETIGIERIDPFIRYPVYGAIDSFQARVKRVLRRKIARLLGRPAQIRY